MTARAEDEIGLKADIEITAPREPEAVAPASAAVWSLPWPAIFA